jgi:hypothetical protein
MRRLLFAALAAVALCLCFAGTSQAQSKQRIIYIRPGGKVNNAQVLNALPAFQRAVGQFSPIWHQERYWGPTIVEALPDNAPRRRPKDAWAVIRITDSPDCWGCYGFHWYVKGNVKKGVQPIPFAEVGTDGNWTVTLTHELFEMMVDPFGRHFHKAHGRNYLVEAADPVEDDSFAYALPAVDGSSVLISDFPTPAWYRPGSAGPYDFMGYVQEPLQVLCGGYVSWKDTAGRWVQEFGDDCL